MDPDQANAPGALDWSRSIRIWIQRSGERGDGPGLGSTRPSIHIKGVLNPFPLFSKSFSLSSSPLLRRSLLFLNPNPNLWNPTQNSMIQGSITSFHGSKHESNAGFHMHWLKRRGSRILSRGIRTALVHFFVQIFFLCVFLVDSLVYNNESPL